MNIGFFADTYLPHLNGVATSVAYFAKQLKKTGNRVYIIAPSQRHYTDQEEDIYRITSIKALPKIPESLRLPVLSLKKSWIDIFRLDYDIIHAHGNGMFSLFGYFIAKHKKVPFVLTFHTLIDHYTHYVLNGKLFSPKQVNKILTRFASFCDLIITPSEKMKNRLKQLGVKKPIVVIPNFVDTKNFKGGKKGYLQKLCNIPKDSLILLSVGRLGQEKNFEFLVKMFRLLITDCPKLHLVIVGEGPDKKTLEKTARRLALDQNIHLTGGIKREYMKDVYRSSFAFTSASISEVHPMVSLEAAAASLPLVLVNDPAFDGVVVDNKNGYIVPLKEQLFAEKIKFLYKDPKRALKMGKESLKIVETNYNPEEITNRLLNIYRNLNLKSQLDS
jgi:1,2-diacylglycerol 3-alpha-glucosyltransferase